MHTFFHGWRRKSGVASLVMACVITGAWIRSMMCQTDLSIRTEKHACVGVRSSNQFCAIYYVRLNIPTLNWDAVNTVEFTTYPFTEQPQMKKWPSGDLRWWFRSVCWHEVDKGPNHREAFLIIPHWAIILPLTFLSAYLILWKPRKWAVASYSPKN
ncbi:MAG TPA: hypothetical protein VGM98_00920 [Schlesneria sp.]|jgi:hypothetical protein